MRNASKKWKTALASHDFPLLFMGGALSVCFESFIISVGVASSLLLSKKVSPLVAILVEFQLYPSSIWQANI